VFQKFLRQVLASKNHARDELEFLTRLTLRTDEILVDPQTDPDSSIGLYINADAGLEIKPILRD
jgi:hypothetical protein